jgi:hypothetical protein
LRRTFRWHAAILHVLFNGRKKKIERAV